MPRIQPDFPSLKGRPTPGRLQKLAKAMKGFDLVCTYNWGAMDAVMAHTLFKDLHNLPPLIHHEDGFDESELKKLKTGRTWYRRIALGKASGAGRPFGAARRNRAGRLAAAVGQGEAHTQRHRHKVFRHAAQKGTRCG